MRKLTSRLESLNESELQEIIRMLNYETSEEADIVFQNALKVLETKVSEQENEPLERAWLIESYWD